MSNKKITFLKITLIVGLLLFLFLVFQFGFLVFLPTSFLKLFLFLWFIITLFALPLIISYLFAKELFNKILNSISFIKYAPAVECITWIIKRIDFLLKVYIVISLGLILVIFISPKIRTQLHSSKGSSVILTEADRKKLPNLQLTVIEYPKVINRPCEPVTIKIKAKNIGKVSLAYADIKNKKYRFDVASDSGNWPVYTTIGLANEQTKGTSTTVDELNSKIEDFGIIKPGEEKILIIKSGSDKPFYYGNGQFPVYLSNVFANEIKDQGEKDSYEFRVELVWLKNKKSHPRLSESNTFKVKGNNLLDEDGLLRQCGEE